ncbi:MAG: 4Fe-4S dicluster domain-containing protein [Chloroflexota bacterium]
MNVLTALNVIRQFSERVNASPITLDSAACVRSRHKSADCSACVDACPTSAFSVDGEGGGLTLDGDRCVGCAACTHLCPTGAIHSRTSADRLLKHVEQHGDAARVELICPYREPVNRQADRDSAAFITPRCLAALAPSTYVELANRGVRHITLRLDACADCPISHAAQTICETAAAAADLLRAAPMTTIVLVSEPPAGKRNLSDLHDTRQTSVSRRGLFQMFTRPLTEPSDVPRLSLPVRLTAEQQRLLPAVVERALQTSDMPDWAPRLVADDSCTGCDVCAKLCPTAALSLQRDDAHFWLHFRAAYCTGCGLCTAGCPSHALDLAPDHQPTDPAAVSSEILVEGALQTCKRCRTAFRAAPGETLCPTCAFRRKNPFGSRVISL